MVDPYTALTIGKSVIGFMEARREHQRAEAERMRNWQASAQARDDAVRSLNRRAIQEAEAASGKQFELELAALHEAETRVAISGESGLGGQTEALKAADVTARRLRAKDVISGNLEMTLDQIEDEKIGVNTQMKNRINSMPATQKPNMLVHAIGAAANAYAAEADITGKNLFTGQAIAKTKPNYVIPKTSGYSSKGWMGDMGALDLDF